MRTLIKTPNAVRNISLLARKVLITANYLDAGFNINLDEVDAELAFYVQYFHNRRKQAENGMKFETLFKGLAQLAKGLFKR